MGNNFLMNGLWSKVNQGTGERGMWQDYEFGVPGKYFVLYEDFDHYVAGDWTVTAAGGGTAALATAAPCLGGVLRVTTANADDDLVSLQRVGNCVVPPAGSKIYFEASFQTLEATQMDWVVGLGITDTTPLAIADSIVFQKDDGDTQVDFKTVASASSSSQDSNIATFAAATNICVGFKVTGTSQVEYYVNGAKKGTFLGNIPAVPLRVTLAHQDGDTGAALGALTSSWDYVICCQERIGYVHA